MTVKTNKTPFYIVIWELVLAFSSIMLLKVSFINIAFLVQCAGVVFYAVYARKICITLDKHVNLIFLLLLVSSVGCLVGGLPTSYIKTVVAICILWIPIYFSYATLETLSKKDTSIFQALAKGIRITCAIEVFWCLIQFLSYRLFHLDMNDLIFVKILHIAETASYYRAGTGVFYPSGLCWHPVFMAPIAILTLAFTKKWYIAALAILDVFLCNNATGIIMLGIAMFMLGGAYIYKICLKRKVGSRVVLILIAIVILMIPVLLKTSIAKELVDKFIFIIQRMLGKADDGGSASAHMSYYTRYWEVLKVSSPIQVLFGYGPGCSGYAFDQVAHQYESLKSWAVESDIMDWIYSKGIVGFVVFYSLMGRIAVKGASIDKKYPIIAVVIMLGGITYNIQFEWMILILLCLWLAVKERINIFEL